MPNPYVGAARAVLGQGLGMGWGDEAEAWVRSKAGDKSYDDNLKKIRGEYAEYSKESPYISGGLELAGGIAPGVAAMLIPGGQAAGAAQLARSTGSTIARMSALGGATGAVAGAGNAPQDDRLTGAVQGGALGTVMGGLTAPVMRGGSAALKWLGDRLLPGESRVTARAAEKMNQALREDGKKPFDLSIQNATDIQRKTPGVIANASPGMNDLAETVAQRTGSGARKIEETLNAQKLGSRERTYGQVERNLNPGNYFDDLADLERDMKLRAAPAYEQAYAFGEVSDPKVLEFLKLPQFKKAGLEAEELLAAEGRTMDFSKPTVENLDLIKRGLDSLIEKETDSLGKVSQLGRVYIGKKNEFLKELDRAVPDYELARGIYSGGADIRDAMRQGMEKFGSMKHEQVVKLMGDMGEAEKEAFRTGVARNLYDQIMKPAQNHNAASRIINSPENQAKLQPLFDSPAKYEMFKAAMEREAQLFGQANKVLGGSQTGKRMQMRDNFESDPGVGQAVAQAFTGGFGNSLMNLAARVASKSQMNEKTASKLADMLMSKDPHEVAAVVMLLEQEAKKAAPQALRAGAAEAGAVTGTMSAGWPVTDPSVAEDSPTGDLEALPEVTLDPKIEEELERAFLESQKKATPAR